MRELEDLLRRESHRERPETPPPGSFADLKSRLGTPGRKRHWLSWVLPLSLLALVILGYSQVDFTTEAALQIKAATQTDEINSLKQETPVKAAPKPIVNSSGPIVIEVNNPLLTEFENRLASSQGEPAKAVPAGRVPKENVTTNADNLPAEKKRIETKPIALSGVSIEEEHDQPRPAEQAVAAMPFYKKKKVIQPIKPSFSTYPSKAKSVTTRTAVQKITNTLTPAVVPTSFSAKPPTSKIKGELSRGGWDFSLSFYAFRRGYTGFTQQYTENANQVPGAFPQVFIIDGEARPLYYLDFLSRTNTGRVGVGQLKMSRQTSSGIRFGAGLTLYRDRSNTEESVRRLENTFPNSYLLVSKRTDTYLLGQVQIGYTFLRRHRVQPWLSAGLQLPLFIRAKGSTYLLHEGRLNFVSEELFNANLFGDNPQVLPSLEGGVQYRFTHKLAGGLNIGMQPREDFYIRPTLGVEVRYHW